MVGDALGAAKVGRLPQNYLVTTKMPNDNVVQLHISRPKTVLKQCCHLGCVKFTDNFILLVNVDTGECAGRKYFCEEHA